MNEHATVSFSLFVFFGAGSVVHTLQFVQVTVGGAVGCSSEERVAYLQVFERNGCRKWAQCVTQFVCDSLCD